MLGCICKDLIEGVDGGIDGGGRREPTEFGFGEGSEGWPIGAPKVGVGAPGAGRGGSPR